LSRCQNLVYYLASAKEFVATAKEHNSFVFLHRSFVATYSPCRVPMACNPRILMAWSVGLPLRDTRCCFLVSSTRIQVVCDRLLGRTCLLMQNLWRILQRESLKSMVASAEVHAARPLHMIDQQYIDGAWVHKLS
jgi:hypothetical protein